MAISIELPINVRREPELPIQQVYGDQSIHDGDYMKITWNWDGPSGSDQASVPAGHYVVIESITASFLPEGGTAFGRADICARNSGGNAIWRLQLVALQPYATVHMPFHGGIRIEEGDWIEVGFVNAPGPGIVFVSVIGKYHSRC